MGCTHLSRLTRGRPTEFPLPLWERDRVRGSRGSAKRHRSGRYVKLRKATHALLNLRMPIGNGLIGACRRQTPHPVPLPQGRAIAFDVVALHRRIFARGAAEYAEIRGSCRATGRSPVSPSHGDSSHQSGSSAARATCRSPPTRIVATSAAPREKTRSPAMTTRREAPMRICNCPAHKGRGGLC